MVQIFTHIANAVLTCCLVRHLLIQLCEKIMDFQIFLRLCLTIEQEKEMTHGSLYGKAKSLKVPGENMGCFVKLFWQAEICQTTFTLKVWCKIFYKLFHKNRIRTA